MGCDVHAIIERFDDGINRWVSASLVDDRREYALFAALAGVRNYFGATPVVEPRGFPPEDAHENRHCRWTYEDKWPVDGEHTPSWFTLEEAERYDAEWLRTAYDDSDWPYRHWLRWVRMMRAVAEIYELDDKHVRVVFNFDS